jgi:hypothetical protein
MVLCQPVYGAVDSTMAPATKKDSKSKTSASASTKPKISPPKPYEYYFNNDANKAFEPDELKPLLAGDSDFYVLFRDDMTGRPRGVALLIPDWSQHAANSRGIDFLRTQLPQYGWVTLSMAVPNNREQVFVTDIPQPRPLASSRQSTKKTQALRHIDEEYMAKYELQMKMRMEALVNEAENYQGYFIVIAQGSSAAVLASLYAKEELAQPEAFIILGALVHDNALNQAMNLNIATTSIPTLDIYQTSQSRWIAKNIRLRQMLAKKHFKISYRASQLHGDISYLNQNQRLLKTIYGWLSRLGL